MQKAQAAAQQESRRGDDEGQNRTVNSERQACARARSQVQHVPNSKQVRDDRHRKDDHSLHRNWNVVDKSRHEERRQRDQQKRRRHRDSRHVGAQIRMVAHNPSLLQVVREHKNQSRESARNITALKPTRAQSYQGTRTGRRSSLRKTSGHRSLRSSVLTGGKDCFSASRIWRSSCSVMSLSSCSFIQA